MANIKIVFDAGPLIRELKHTDLKSCFKNLGKDSELLRKIVEIEKEWKIILTKTEKITTQIAENGVSRSIGGEALDIANHCKRMGYLAGPLLVEGGSFVPGPVGIVCSLALAIVDFSAGNIFGGFMNLLGCIPFAKAGAKAAKPLLNNIVSGLLKNPEFVKMTKNVSGAIKPTTGMYTRNVMPEASRIYKKLFPESTKAINKPSVKPSNPHVGNYAPQAKNPSLGEIIQHNSQRTGKIKSGQPGQYSPNYSSVNYEDYILRTNTGKYNPYSHLF